MPNLGNKVLATAMVVLCLLMATMVFVMNRIIDKACNCDQLVAVGVEEINKTIDEIRKEVDSISVHSDTTVTGSYRELQDRYNGR